VRVLPKGLNCTCEKGLSPLLAKEKLAAMMIGRLAPTPSGGLHLGNARTFLVAWLSARAAGGVVRLRIDDLDAARVKPGYIEHAIADLRWLGLDWDGEPLYQSRRGEAYAAALQQLRDAGRAYPCVCSRREIETAAHAPHAGEEGPAYPRTCRHKPPPAGKPAAWRFAVHDGEHRVGFVDELRGRCEYESDDFVIFRNDGIAAYQLATVVDDLFLGVTEVVRGDDLLRSTARQCLLCRALGVTLPRFLHVPLVLDAAGERMAKRRDSMRLSALREAGVDAACVVGELAASCGWAEPGERVMPAGLVGRFDLAKLPREPVSIPSDPSTRHPR
jgi:glutamyl-tRNA synthetase